ncbi:class I SAM-dependent methyltransferase [Paenibacillus sp. GCM10027626]|uniref:class I SAM-dependent methyltransferase n=1 Tax=Paenibacillus sp. GCM10027626 TaxID=3273411 RepID=UPI00363FD8D0
MNLKTRQQKYWDNGAELYDEVIAKEMNGFKKQAWMKLIERQIGPTPNQAVLDVGTGPGFFAILLAGMGHTVTAVDSSPEMLKNAHKNAQAAQASIKFINSDLHDLPFAEGSFDVIISRNVTWTLRDPESVYRLWAKLLKTGGRSVIFDANWNAHLTNPEAAAKVEEGMEQARAMGFNVKESAELEKEGNDISRQLPLTFKQRPQWDEQALYGAGFKLVELGGGFDADIYTEDEQIAYGRTPMFSICAIK